MFLNENITPTLLRENEAFARDFINNDVNNMLKYLDMNYSATTKTSSLGPFS